MNECPRCKTKVSSKVKIKLWWLVSQKCNICGNSLKLDKNPLFKITFRATVIVVILMILLYNLEINVFLSAFIVLVLGLSVPIPFIIKYVGFID